MRNLATYVLLFCVLCIVPGTIPGVNYLTRNVDRQVRQAEWNLDQAEALLDTIRVLAQENIVLKDSVKKLYRLHNHQMLMLDRTLWREP